MANATFGVNIIPKNNTVTLGNSTSTWGIASYDLGSNKLANIQSAIVTLAGNMGNGEQKNITFTISAASSPFYTATYIGQLMRISATRLRVIVSEAVYVDSEILGRYKDGTWSWKMVVVQ